MTILKLILFLVSFLDDKFSSKFEFGLQKVRTIHYAGLTGTYFIIKVMVHDKINGVMSKFFKVLKFVKL